MQVVLRYSLAGGIFALLSACSGGGGSTPAPAPAQVSLSTTALDFGFQTVDTVSSPKVVTVTNTGGQTLVINSVTVVGSTAPTRQAFVTTNSCSSLTPGASCTVTTTFQPLSSGIGLYQDVSIAVATNASTPATNVTLRGVGSYSPGGIWQGTDSLTNLPVVGLVTEAGEFHFLRQDGTQYFGTMAVNAYTASASLQGVTQRGTAWPDGSTTGTGTYTGTVTPRASLNGAVTFRTSAGNTSTATVNLTFNSQYNMASSLARIAGNYRDTATNAVITVSSSGVVFSQDAVTGCVVNGTISLINTSYNAYRVHYSFANCTGPSSYLNGTVADGLGTIDASTSIDQAIIGVVNYTAGYSLIQAFPRI